MERNRCLQARAAGEALQRGESGAFLPASYAAMVGWEVPPARASALCVIPDVRRRDRITVMLQDVR